VTVNTKELTALLKSEGISPSKKLGQNFLCNEGVVKRIIEACRFSTQDRVLEIGPGTGSITQTMTDQVHSVTAVEIDAGLVRVLKKQVDTIPNITVVHNDILKMDIPPHVNKVVGNLPYYCSSEILFRVAAVMGVQMGCFMLQKEMSQRLAAAPGSGNYGAITVNLQLYFSIEPLFNIDKQSFFPQPEVTSTFIRMIRNQDTGLNQEQRKAFHLLVKSAFWGRRKTLRKALTDSPHLELASKTVEALLEKSGINEKERGETLSVDEYKKMAIHYTGITQ